MGGTKRAVQAGGDARAWAERPLSESRAPSSHGSDARERVTWPSDEALILAGLALYWPLLTLGKSALETLLSETPSLGPLSLLFSGLLAAGALIVTLAGLRPGIGLRGVMGCGAATSIVLFAGALLPSVPPLDAALGLLGCAGMAATVFLLTLGWGGAALAWHAKTAADSPGGGGRQTTRASGACLLITVAASLCLSFAVRLATALIMGDSPSGVPGTTCLVIYPALACLPWAVYASRHAARTAGGSGALTGGVKSQAADAHLATGADTQVAGVCPIEGPRGRERWLLVAAASFVTLASILAGIRTAGTDLYPIDPSGSRYVLALAFSGVLVVGALALRQRPIITQGVCWGTTIVLAFAGVLLTMSTGAGHILGINALLVARLVVWALFWMLPVEAAMRGVGAAQGGSGGACAGLLSTFYLLPQGIAYLLTDSLYALGPAVSSPAANTALDIATIAVALALVACALVIVALLVSQDAEPAGKARPLGIPEDPQGSLPAQDTADESVTGAVEGARHAVCQAIAAEAGLTERESAVLELLSLGHTVQRIADEEGVTPNTVRTHSKGLYRKLGCHSKQEVIDLVARRMHP